MEYIKKEIKGVVIIIVLIFLEYLVMGCDYLDKLTFWEFILNCFIMGLCAHFIDKIIKFIKL